MLKKDENNTVTGKIAVVGDKDSVLAFKAIGLEVHAVESADEAATVLKKLARGLRGHIHYRTNRRKSQRRHSEI